MDAGPQPAFARVDSLVENTGMPRKNSPFLLGVVLQSIVGQPICLEIKNDDEIHGTLESVDGDLNISLLDVTYVFSRVG